MTEDVKKSVLCDFVSRHSDFNFETYVAQHEQGEYDIWNSYCLPMWYTNASDEYDAIRNSCAMFDISPMKKYRFRGKDAGAFLDRVLTAPISQIADMRAAYGLLCNEQGLLVDDGIATKFASDDYLLFVSEIDLDAHFSGYNDFDDLSITEETPSMAGLALQGPKSCAVLNQLGFEGVERLGSFDLGTYDLAGHQILVGRLGFTGDLGYEIWFPPTAIEAITQAFGKAEDALGFLVPGYALSALQICRIEAGMIVPGWDTAGQFDDPSNERTPFELTLGWNVKLKRDGAFAGKDALIGCKATGPRFKMRGVKINGTGPLEDGQPLFARIEGRSVQVGKLPSVIWHTAEKVWIGFASIEIAHADIEEIYVLDGDNEVACQFCSLPFIDLEQRTKVPADM